MKSEVRDIVSANLIPSLYQPLFSISIIFMSIISMVIVNLSSNNITFPYLAVFIRGTIISMLHVEQLK
jgi:hypothetical protein